MRKSILCVVLCTLLMASAGCRIAYADEQDGVKQEQTREQQLLYGDVDRDGAVRAEDALAILRHVVSLETIADQDALALADVKHDGKITAEDALYVLQMVVKLRPQEVYAPAVTDAPVTDEPAPETPSPTVRPARTPLPETSPTLQPQGGEMDINKLASWNLWSAADQVPYYNEENGQDIPRLYPYFAEENTTGACVIVIPGGGYAAENTNVSGVMSIADALCKKGITAFALQYRTAPYTYKAMISDVCRAVRFVRYYHKSLGIDPDKVTVMGFSAGGHLALMSTEHYDDADIEVTGDAIDAWSAKPDSAVLGYAVVSMMEAYGHQTSRENFLGAEVDNESLRMRFSGELGVTKDTPPMFLWHCKKDHAVSYESSEMLAKTLEENGVLCELHIYETGGHGLGLAQDNEEVSKWFDACVEWIHWVNFDYSVDTPHILQRNNP